MIFSESTREGEVQRVCGDCQDFVAEPGDARTGGCNQSCVPDHPYFRFRCAPACAAWTPRKGRGELSE